MLNEVKSRFHAGKKSTLFSATIHVTLALLILNCSLAKAQATNKDQIIGYTLEDRDRAIRMEIEDRDRAIRMETKMDERFEAMQKEMDTRFEAMDDKLNKLYTLIYFVLGGVFGLIGFIMYDRRSYIKPVKEDINELRKSLIEYAKDQPKLADILRSHGLM